MDPADSESSGAQPPRRGRIAQDIAAEFLRLEGYTILDANRRGGGGEIDLIVRRGRILVFVEVRLRRAGSWVSAAASIGRVKRQRWRRCARDLLRRRADLHWPGREIRFDVVALTRSQGRLEIDHRIGVDLRP